MIDFGLAKKYTKDAKHILYSQGKNMLGTVRFASLNSHYGIQPTRRDDLESWFYCLIYFIRGELPWQNQKAPTRKDKLEKIMGLKLEYRPDLLCKNLPQNFIVIQTHIRGLKYD